MKSSLRGRKVLFFSFCFFILVRLAFAQEDWRAGWERTVEAAKKEGRVVLFCSDDYDILFREFQKKYPEIKVEAVTTANVPGVWQRVMSERRAEKYLMDVYLGGATTGYALYNAKALDPIKPALVLPEILDASKWWKEGKYNYSDSEGTHLFSFNGELQPYFAYNTKLVNPAEIRSYWDFLNPKWKKRMVVFDPTVTAPIATPLRFIYYHPELGPEFLKRLLTEMELIPSRDFRQISDWLVVGKFALSLFTSISRLDLDVAKKQGLPVDWFGPKSLKEGAILSNAQGNVALLNRAPHPNAAKVAINWLLSREGQIAYQKNWNGRHDSLRIDVPKDDIQPYARRTEDVPYVVTERPDWIDIEPISKLVNQAWKNRS